MKYSKAAGKFCKIQNFGFKDKHYINALLKTVLIKTESFAQFLGENFRHNYCYYFKTLAFK